MKWLYLNDVFVNQYLVYMLVSHMWCVLKCYTHVVYNLNLKWNTYSMKLMCHMCVLDSCTINVFVYIDDDWHNLCRDWVWLQGTILSHIRLELSRPLMKAIADALNYLFLRCFDRWCETMQMTWCFYWTKVQEHAPFHQMHIYIGTDLVHKHTQVSYRFERYGTYFFKITDIIYTHISKYALYTYRIIEKHVLYGYIHSLLFWRLYAHVVDSLHAKCNK